MEARPMETGLAMTAQDVEQDSRIGPLKAPVSVTVGVILVLLFGVVAVVQSRTDDFARARDRCEQSDIGGVEHRERTVVDAASFVSS